MIAYELFSCSGGMSLGFRRAGIEFDLVVDKDPFACASYEENMGRAPLQVDARALLELDLPTPDLLVADPPCTPWSTAGKGRGLADPRDCMLVTRDLLLKLRPRAWLIANVPGLQLRTRAADRAAIFDPLTLAGYCIDYAYLNAADYGVPQHRWRPFWYGHRGGPCVRWPRPTHADPRHATDLGLRPWVTCREALADLPSHLAGRSVEITRRTKAHPLSEIDEPARTTSGRKGHSGNVICGGWDRHPTSSLDEPAMCVKTNGGRNSRGGSMIDAIVLSERAAARLQGFPDGWHFLGPTKRARWSQIGQALPPPLAEAVARSIREQLDAR